jgi:hypothetical protein
LEERGLEAASTSALNETLISIPTLVGASALKRRKRRAPAASNDIVPAKADKLTFD